MSVATDVLTGNAEAWTFLWLFFYTVHHLIAGVEAVEAAIYCL